MINFTTKINSVPVSVNPKLVTHVSLAPNNGAIIHFVGDKTIHVNETFLQVVGMLQGNS